MSDKFPLTLSVPEAGRRYFGLSRNASYAAARAGEIPTMRIGKKLLRVPVRALERMLDAVPDPVPERAPKVVARTGRSTRRSPSHRVVEAR
jgi:Helix-turn-helix domain